MSAARDIEIRPARLLERRRIDEFLSRPVPMPGAAEGAGTFLGSSLSNLLVAVRSNEVIGACSFVSGAGRCAVVQPPRLLEWDADLAARLCRAAAALSHTRDGARLIQALTEPEGTSPLAGALERAGFDRLAVLSYMRRSVRPEERNSGAPPALAWRQYRWFRHREFGRVISETYEDSLDCPKLSGLRTVDDAITTHKHTGIFSPQAWHLAMSEGRPVAVVLVNNLQGRGEIVYLGVVPAARRHSIGRALVARAVRDTAAMGLPLMGLAVDIANSPAMRLYEETGFREIRRRLAYFVPGDRLASLAE